MSEADRPDLSVSLVCAGGWRPLAQTLRAMAAQTVADRVELIVTVPEAAPPDDLAPLLGVFHHVQVIEESPILNVDFAAGRALLRGQAPVVASVEDHAFPDADWAEAIIDAYRRLDAVSIGSTVVNANPGTALSWSNMLLAYGQWNETRPEGPAEMVPHHNGTWRRDALAGLETDELWRWFDREGTVTHKLREAGGSFAFTPRARVRHVNPSALGATFRLRLDAGRLYAANRARDERWGWPKRLAYTVLAPLIPAVRYARMRRELFGNRAGVTEARHGPAMLIGLVFDAMGQMLGYVAGPGGARDRLATFEMDRLQHLAAADRRAFAPEPDPRSV